MKIEFGFLPLLTIIFAILKLTHVINWSWWFIILPISLYLIIPILALIFIVWGERKWR